MSKIKLKLPRGGSNRGAQMGRANYIAPDAPVEIKLRMQRLDFVDGDYDQWGAYWGGGTSKRVYCAWNGESDSPVARVFVWALSRNQAKEAVRGVFSKRQISVKFYR